MKVNVSVTVIVAITVLTVMAAVYRISTAPDRIRQRQDAARAACLGNGGQWVLVDSREACRPAPEQKKV